MKRSIVAFGTDAEGEPFARLDCGHPQHVRHKPPFVNRPWVTSQSGRDAMLGTELDCLRCDRMEWPEGLVSYKRTPEMTEKTVPAGLLRDHATKRGVWGRLCVTEGGLEFCAEAPVDKKLAVRAPSRAVIVPNMKHHVRVDSPVKFYVEFWKRA